jgi:hypothetical protein
MVDEASRFARGDVHASVRRMGLQILCSRSELAGLAALVGILDRADGGLQWLLITYAHTYVTVILLSMEEKAVRVAGDYGCYN